MSRRDKQIDGKPQWAFLGGLSKEAQGEVWKIIAEAEAEIERTARSARAVRAGSRWPIPPVGRDQAIATQVAEGISTLDEIGRPYGLSRERVRQIAGKAGVSRNRRKVPMRPRKGPPPPIGRRCVVCGERQPGTPIAQHREEAHGIRGRQNPLPCPRPGCEQQKRISRWGKVAPYCGIHMREYVDAWAAAHPEKSRDTLRAAGRRWYARQTGRLAPVQH